MLQDATLKNIPQSVEDAINSCTDPSSLRQVALNAMAEAGIIVRTRDDFDFRLNPEIIGHQAASTMPAQGPVPEPTCMRVFYPHGNNRMELYGTSEAELDAQERQIRTMYGHR